MNLSVRLAQSRIHENLASSLAKQGKEGIDYSQKGLLLTKERREWLAPLRKLAIEQTSCDGNTATDRVTNDALMRRLHAYYTSIFAASRCSLTMPLCYCLGVQNANIIRRMGLVAASHSGVKR
jgi:hypothetical protein